MSQFTTEEKVRIVLDGMRYPEGIDLTPKNRSSFNVRLWIEKGGFRWSM